MAGTKIEWADKTWNCITGCTEISAGCENCYAKRMTTRLQGIYRARIQDGKDPKGMAKYSQGFQQVRVHPDALKQPSHWPTGCRIFVNSMSDTLHVDVPSHFLMEMVGMMRKCPQHQFMILTKRHHRIREFLDLPLTSNVWIGVSIESQKYAFRLNPLILSGYTNCFLSLEPMLGPMPALNLDGIAWVIVGGESGPGARVLKPEWVRDVRDQCIVRDVPFFFKQWGGVNKADKGRKLDGRTWDQFPAGLIL